MFVILFGCPIIASRWTVSLLLLLNLLVAVQLICLRVHHNKQLASMNRIARHIYISMMSVAWSRLAAHVISRAMWRLCSGAYCTEWGTRCGASAPGGRRSRSARHSRRGRRSSDTCRQYCSVLLCDRLCIAREPPPSPVWQRAVWLATYNLGGVKIKPATDGGVPSYI